MLLSREVEPGCHQAVRTGADGSFRLEGVEGGAYLLFVDAIGHGKTSRELDVDSADQTVLIELSGAIRVLGRVVDRSGRGVEGATVSGSVASEGGVPESLMPAQTGSGGAFGLLRFGPGQLRLSAHSEQAGIEKVL